MTLTCHFYDINTTKKRKKEKKKKNIGWSTYPCNREKRQEILKLASEGDVATSQ